jgi:AcrR family transcriptional regulator
MESRRDELIKAFIQTFCEYGLDGTTTKRLAKAANLSEAGLYVHFKNKEDILSACVEEHFRDVKDHTEALMKKYGGRLADFVDEMFQYVKSMLLENRFIFQVYSHPYYSELIKGLRCEMLDNIKPQALILQVFGISQETAFTLVLLFNSALNNYILTQDEESFHIQMDFLLKTLEKYKNKEV